MFTCPQRVGWGRANFQKFADNIATAHIIITLRKKVPFYRLFILPSLPSTRKHREYVKRALNNLPFGPPCARCAFLSRVPADPKGHRTKCVPNFRDSLTSSLFVYSSVTATLLIYLLGFISRVAMTAYPRYRILTFGLHCHMRYYCVRLGHFNR